MLREKLLVFLSYTLIGFIAYRNCFDIFIPGDNYSFLYALDVNGFSSITQSAREGAPYFVAYPLLLILYKLFGTEPSLWMITSILFHTLNAWLVYMVFSALLKLVFVQKKKAIAVIAGLLFLVSPYQTEDVLWTAINIRWLFHAASLLAGLYIFIKYLTDPSPKKLITIHFLFLLGLFSNEFTFIIPLICVVFWWAFSISSLAEFPGKKLLLHVLAPQACFIGMYFVICKLVSGYWFWHGGPASDITQTNNYLVVFLKYIAKFFLLYRYLPAMPDETLRLASGKTGWLLLIFISGLALAALLLRLLFRKNKNAGYLTIALIACFSISLLPVLPLDSSFLTYIYPDRYGYIASAFFYGFITLGIYLLIEKLAVPLLTGYIILNWVLLEKTQIAWENSSDYCNRLIRNYDALKEYDRVYILNVPTYFNGVAAFRSAFAETALMKNGFPVERTRIVAGCYQHTSADTVHSVYIHGDTVIVSRPKWKTPFFSVDGGWAHSYETHEYSVDFAPDGCSYRLVFKGPIPSNSAFIYTSLDTWKKAN